MTEAASQIATDGRPLLGVAVRVVGDGGPLSPGEVGAIAVAGPTISPGQLVDGDRLQPSGAWLRTRDLGRLDADGRLEVIGRADDVIITGGENVHPREVEQALESHPAVAEACAFGLPDPLWGEIVAAWVRPLGPTAPDIDTLAAHARARLAGCKIPRRLTVVPDFPRSAAGKILRHAVRSAAVAAETADDLPTPPRR
jgi:acyl-CoA synthetase (AMP-forming)/AMP-acid ligase II